MTNLQYFLSKYRNSELLIDTNLLIVLLVGNTDKSLIEKLKPTRTYTKTDYELLIKITRNFRIVTTAHILTEASNLCEKVETFYKLKIFKFFSELITDVIEIPMPSKSVVISPIFLKLGLTDSVIFKLSKDGLVVLTDDLDLHSYILGSGGTAANMNLFRGEYLIK